MISLDAVYCSTNYCVTLNAEMAHKIPPTIPSKMPPTGPPQAIPTAAPGKIPPVPPATDAVPTIKISPVF